MLAGAALWSGCGSDGAGTIHIESPKARKQMMQTGAGTTPADAASTAFVYAIPINSVVLGTPHGSVTQPLKVAAFHTSIQIAVPADLRDHPQVRWAGTVSREDTARYYRDADVFLFPTYSDGFGLTQLEAQAWKLPIIASVFCGAVVED